MTLNCLTLKYLTRSAAVVLTAAVLMSLALTTQSCQHKVELTTIAIEDSVRHYFAVARGQHLKVEFRLANTGKTPLVITDIQPSCGCIVGDNDQRVVPPGKVIKLDFVYYSEKNIGEVKHKIRLFGNIYPDGRAVCNFDVNVVPASTHTADYEEIHNEIVARQASIEQLVDGDESEKGYWVDSILEYSHVGPRYPWREEPGKSKRR